MKRARFFFCKIYIIANTYARAQHNA